MNPRLVALIGPIIERECPAGFDRVDWRAAQEQFRVETAPATADGKPWPSEGFCDLSGPSWDELHPRRPAPCDTYEF